jgi:hypothetical protein
MVNKKAALTIRPQIKKVEMCATPLYSTMRSTSATILGVSDAGNSQLSKPQTPEGNVMSARKRLLAVATTVIIWATFQPGAVSAQTSGVGGDGNTRVLWRGTDGSITLWKLDPVLNFVNNHAYGPYAGWSPIAITTAANNNTYVLCRYTDNSIAVWEVDPNLNYITQKNYGPYRGWIAKGLSVDTNGGSLCRVIWRKTTGEISVWTLDPNLNSIGSHVYGPYFGWDPGSTD